MATITKRKWTTGKGEPREAWSLAFTDRTGKRHKIQFSKKRDADAKRIEIEGQVRSNAFRSTSETVTDAVKAYVEHLEARHAEGRRASTVYVRGARSQLETHVVPNIGTKPLSDLTRGDVAKLRDDLLKGGLSVVRTRTVLATLSRTLSYAEERDQIASNPAKGTRVIGSTTEGNTKVTPPPRATLALLLREASNDLELRIRFASQTGLRASEQWALQWRDIDFKRSQILVRRTVDNFGVVHDHTKTKAGVRSVPLSEKLAAKLAPLKGSPQAYVFPAPGGSFTRHTNWTKRSWKPLLAAVAKKAKAEGSDFKPIGWHALRHFAISTWVLAGLNLKAVQALAGHSSLQTTMDRYAHLLPDDAPLAMLNRLAEEQET